MSRRLGGGWAAWIAGLLVLALPGLLVRGITVSNSALEFALAPGFLLAAWTAWDRRSARWLVGAGALLGLCLLTKLTLIVLAPCLLVAAARVRRPLPVVASFALPVVLLGPWLVGHYDLNAAAREQQTPYLYPGGVPDWGIGDLPGKLASLLEGSVPQEWSGQLGVWWVGLAARGLVLALVVLAVLYARRIAFFALPVVAAVALMVFTCCSSSGTSSCSATRRLLLAPLAVAVAAVAGTRALRNGLIVAAGLLGLLWVDLLGAYLFTDVGDSLGI